MNDAIPSNEVEDSPSDAHRPEIVGLHAGWLAPLLPTERGRRARTLRLIERAGKRADRGQAQRAVHMLKGAVGRARSLAPGPERNAILGTALETLGSCELTFRPPSEALVRISEVRELGQEPAMLLQQMARRAEWSLERDPSDAGAVLELCEQARKADRRLAWPHATFGKVAFVAARFERAAYCLGHARALGTSDREVDFGYHFALGELAFSVNDLQRAAEQLALAADVAEQAGGTNQAWIRLGARARAKEGHARIMLARERPDISVAELKPGAREELAAAVARAGGALTDGSDAATICAVASASLLLDRPEDAQRTLERHAHALEHPDYPYLLALALWRNASRQTAPRLGAELRQRALALLRRAENNRADAATLALRGALELASDCNEVAAVALESAAQQLSTLPEQAPLARLVSQLLGQALFAIGRFDEASARVEADSREGGLLRARALHKSGKIEEAIAAFTALERRYSQDGAVLHHHGCALADGGQWHLAHQTLSRAITLGQLAAYRERGHVSLRLGDPASAFADYSAGAEIFPDALDLPIHCALGLWLCGRQAEARAAVAALIASPAPAHSDLVFSLQGMLHEHDGNHLQAITAYRQALRASDLDPHLWGRLCCALVHAGRRDDAILCIEQALTALGSLQRLPAQALLAVGPAVSRAQRWELAAAIWQAYLAATAVDEASATRELAVAQLCGCQQPRIRLALERGQAQRAAELAEEALEHAPHHAALLVMDGLSRLMLGHATHAAQALDRALPGLVASARPTVAALLALAHAAAGEPTKAKAALSLHDAPLSPKLQLVLAALLGDWERVQRIAAPLDLSPGLLPFVSAALLNTQDHVGFMRLVQTHSEDPTVLAQRALANARRRDFGAALQTLSESLPQAAEHAPTRTWGRTLVMAIAAAATRSGDWTLLAQARAFGDAWQFALDGLEPLEPSLAPLGALYGGQRAAAIDAWERQLSTRPNESRLLHSLLLAVLHVRDDDAGCRQRAWRSCLAYGFALANHPEFWNTWTARRARDAALPVATEQGDELRLWLVDELLIGPLEEHERQASSLGERQQWHALVLLAWREKFVSAAMRRLQRSVSEPWTPAGAEYLSRTNSLDLAVQFAGGSSQSVLDIPEFAACAPLAGTLGELVNALTGRDWEAYILHVLGHSERSLRVALAARSGERPGCALVRLTILLSCRQSEAIEQAWLQQQLVAEGMEVAVCARIEALPDREGPNQEAFAVAKRVAAEHGVQWRESLTSSAVHYRSINPAQAVLTLTVGADLGASVPVSGRDQDPEALARLIVAAALEVAKARATRRSPPHATSSSADVTAYTAALRDALQVLSDRIPEVAAYPALTAMLRERLEETALTAVNCLQRARDDGRDHDPLRTLDAAIAVLETANAAPGLARVPPTLAEHYDMQARRAFPPQQDEDTDEQLPALDEGMRWATKAYGLSPGTHKYQETLAIFSNRRGIVHLAARRHHDALRDFETSLRATPENPIVLAHRADAHAGCQDWDRAEEDLVRAAPLAKTPQQREYVLLRAMHHCRIAAISRANAIGQRWERGDPLDRSHALNELHRAMQHMDLAREAAQALGRSTADIDEQKGALGAMIRRFQKHR